MSENNDIPARDSVSHNGIVLTSANSSRCTITRTEIVASGTPLCQQPSEGGAFPVSGGSFTIKDGGAQVTARVTIDDSGTLTILDSDGNGVLSVSGGVDDWHKTTNPTHWHGTSSAFLPAGSYSVVGLVNNTDMKESNCNNLAYFRFEVTAQYNVVIDDKDDDDDDKEEEPSVCDPCDCCSQDGDDTNPPADETPGSSDEECGGSVGSSGSAPSPQPAALMSAEASDTTPVAVVPSTSMRYHSIWGWKARLQDGVLTIRPSSGRRMRFAIHEGSSVAMPVSLTQHHAVRVELQNSNLTPCTSGSPAFWTLTEASGRRVRFETTNGTVAAVVSASGKVTTAEVHATQVQERFDAVGNMVSCYSPTQGLMLSTSDERGAAVLSWYAPANVTVDENGNYVTSGEPYRTSTHLTTVVNGVETTTVTRQQAGLPAHTVIRVVDGNTVTVTRGTGEDAIIRTWVTTYPEAGMTQRVETVRKGSADATPASCTCLVRKLTEGGWLKLSETEGYGTELARTTTYDYNPQFLVSRINRPDGGYTEYEYDADGRVTKETTPWGDGGKKRMRYVYDSLSARFYDNRPVKVYTDYQDADSGWLNIKVVDYTYEDTPQAERITSVTHIAGTSQVQTTIEESFGESPKYPYAAGKPKFSQDIAGVQTVHTYEATSEHGATHKHTAITKANNELVAGQSRKTEKFIASNDTVLFEQQSIWDGTEWLLLSTAAHEYDEQQRLIKTTRGNGRVSTKSWMCCGLLSETDEDGIRTDYAYNTAHQQTETTRSAVYDGDTCITPETITEYVRDAAGRILTTTRRVGAMEATESTTYDALGRVVSQTDILGRTTTTAYSEDGLTTTVTTPTGATLITVRNTDGSVASVSGTAQRELHYSYDFNNKRMRETVRTAGGDTLSQTLTNGFGQTVAEATPSTTGFVYTRREYNAKGQLTRQYQDTGSNTTPTAATLYEYDSFGNVTKQTLKLDETPTVANSPIMEFSYGVETTDDGVFQVTTQTRYNAEGNPLTSTQKQLISELSATWENKWESTNERNLTSTQRTAYNNNTKRTTYSTVPTSNVTAEAVAVDGFTIRQKDNAGITTTAARHYTADGMTLTQTDGRGNTTTTVTDKAGRTLTVTDAAGHTTTTEYDSAHNQPSVITDAMGNTTCYRYDERGRKVAEWGTGIQPAVFSYDDSDRLTSLTTFRADTETVNDDPRDRTDGDTTTWSYHDATGLELRKTYADGSHVDKTYDAYKRLSIETLARGITKTHRYEHARGLLLGTTYSDGTTARSYQYNHLGQLTQVVDDAGTRTIGYNRYGEQETDSLAAGGVTHLITEARDNLGRNAGYTYAKNGALQQTVTTGYGSDGRITSAGFQHKGAEKQFDYSYLPGTNLLQTLTMPCNMTLTQSYEANRDLLTGMAYKRGTTGVAERAYTYDTLGRPLTHRTARKGITVNDTFAHSNRSELTEATVNGGAYRYSYDNIGNRTSAQEAAEEATAYTANALNQYTAIDDFAPTYDADGNQTLVKTTTGIWTVAYNAENRPITFTNNESNTVVECAYDSMGRRATKKVTNNGEITLHQRYIYRGYLQIACCDQTRANHPCLWFITWDPTQPVATRPLVIQKSGTWYCYGWDLTKNICEVFDSNGYINTIYTYTPYGEVTSSGSTTQPIQWSSEYLDTELGLVYYNYRHYNPADGRWIGRDPIGEDGNKNLVTYVKNAVIQYLDILGLVSADELIKCINIQIEAQVRWWLFGRDMISWKPGRENAIHKTSKFSGYPMAYVRVEWINSNECCKIKREYLKNPSVNIYFEVWKTNLNGEKYQHTLPGNMTSNVLLGRRDPQEVTLAMASHYNGNGDFAHGSQTIGLGNSTYKFQLLISVGKYTILDEEYYL